MKLNNVIQKLNVGALTSVAITNKGAGIKSIDYPQICSHINDFVSDFYTRFHLLNKEVVIRAIAGKREYFFDYKYAESNTSSNEPVKYIVDSHDNPFQEDVSVVRSVTSTTGEELPVNDPNNRCSVFITGFNSIQVPEGYNKEGMGFSVIYEANAPELPLDTGIDLTTNILLPRFIQKGLVAYVEGSIFLNMGGNNVNKGVALRNIAEEEVRKVEREGLLPPKDVQVRIGERLEDWL